MQQVESSITKMQGLFSTIPESRTGFNKGYFFQKENISFNGIDCGNINSVKIDTVKAIVNFKKEEKKEFIKLCKYLKSQQITSCYFDGSLGFWMFEYRETDDGDFNDARNIILYQAKDSLAIKKHFKILDRKNRLLLVAYEDAKIM
jgi:hypothetical protein